MNSELKFEKLGKISINLDSQRIPIKASDRIQGQYPYYGASGIVDYVKNYLFEGLHLLVSEDGENLRTRKTPIAFLAEGKFWANNHAHIITGIPDISDTKYLMYALSCTDISGYLSGSTQPKLTQENLNNIKIPFPDYQKQKQIANILSSLDNKIDLNRQMCKTLEAIASTLFKSWFIDFNPVKAKAAGREPEGLSPDIAELFPDSFIDSPLGQIPKGWEVSSIYELIDICYGAPYKSELFNQEKRGLPVIRIRDLKTGEPGNFTEEKHPREIRVHPGDVLAGMDAEFIPFIWKGAIAVLNQRVLLARPKFAIISNSFVIEMLKPLMGKEQNAQVGTTVAHIGKKDIDKFKICNPGFNILKSHQANCEPFLQKLINNNKQIYSLTKIRDTLLPKLISGEIRIQEAEMLISATI